LWAQKSSAFSQRLSEAQKQQDELDDDEGKHVGRKEETQICTYFFYILFLAPL
jgi:hypothetical protein